MIYLKKDNEIQTAFIPKNGSYEGKLSYKEGYEVGKAEGIAEGKLTPYTTKGVFDKNGYYDRVWAIDWSRNVEMPISWFDNDNIVEVSFLPYENSALISTRGAFIDIFLQDEKMIVNYKNFMLEIPCKYQMWHTLKLQDKYVYLDGERYEYPNFDEYFNGTAFFGKSRRNGMFCRSFVSYIYVTEDNGVEMYYYYGREDGKVKRLRNENGNWLFQTMEFGVWNHTTNTPPMDDVLVRVEGGATELNPITIYENGVYEGAYNRVEVQVPDLNGSYDEGYNNGKAEGGDCPELTELNVTENGTYEGAYNKVNVDVPQEGGSCNLEETRWGNPLPFDVNESYLIIQPSMGYDGMKKVALNMDDYNAEKYNEGYEAGKAEGGDCPELTELNVTENGTYEGAYNKVNVDVPQEGGSCDLGQLDVNWNSGWYENEYYADKQGYDGYNYVHIDATTALNEKYNEGYEAGKAEGGGGSCNLQDKCVGYNSPDELTDGAYVDVYPDEGYDGMSRVVADVRGLMQNKYDEGYNTAIANDANLIPAKVEKKFNTLAFRTENLYDGDIIRDKSKLRGFYDESAEDYFIAYTQNKNGVVICEHGEISKPSVTTIENNALDWNKIEYFYSFTIHTFGENMTRDMGSNVRQIHLDSPIMNTDGADIIFRSGCFATSNLLNKIVFYQPLKVAVYDNAFEGVSSYGEVIVVGEDNAENRAKYDTLMAQLGDGWSLNFVNQYDE